MGIITDKNICPDCGTENEIEYVYCKNCGARLNVSPVDKQPQTAVNPPPAQQYTPPAYSAAPHYTPPAQPLGYDCDSIGGIPVGEVEAFTGSASITRKFARMEKTGGKISWCLPAALLGFLLGPAGSAIWFFRRKMVKIALILLAVGTVIFTANAALGALTYQPSDASVFESVLEGYINGEIDTAEYFKGMFEWLFGGYTLAYVLLGFLGNAINGATGVLCGLFGDYAYKKHTVTRIQRYRFANVDPRYYQLGLTALGGTSGGLMTLGIVGIWVMFLAANIVSVFLG